MHWKAYHVQNGVTKARRTRNIGSSRQKTQSTSKKVTKLGRVADHPSTSFPKGHLITIDYANMIQTSSNGTIREIKRVKDAEQDIPISGIAGLRLM
jgi:hypothetical protein